MQQAGEPVANLVLHPCFQIGRQPLNQAGCKNKENFASNHLQMAAGHITKKPLTGLFSVC